jgi:hypothetical protein
VTGVVDLRPATTATDERTEEQEVTERAIVVGTIGLLALRGCGTGNGEAPLADDSAGHRASPSWKD